MPERASRSDVPDFTQPFQNEDDTMFAKIFGGLTLAAVVALSGLGVARFSENGCCFPGSPCCGVGEPCCLTETATADDCCATGAACCATGEACCATGN
jgi:hypothetical protein